MALLEALTFSAEKVSPGLTVISLLRSSSRPSRSPASLTSLTEYLSPSVMDRVMKMSLRSGEIVTCGESTLNSR